LLILAYEESPIHFFSHFLCLGRTLSKQGLTSYPMKYKETPILTSIALCHYAWAENFEWA